MSDLLIYGANYELYSTKAFSGYKFIFIFKANHHPKEDGWVVSTKMKFFDSY